MLMFYLSLMDTEAEKTKFEQIYHQYRKLMFYIANQILCDDALAEDAVQDAFIKIIENLDKIEDIGSHKTKSFLVIIVRNHSINIYNERKRKAWVPLENADYLLFEDLVLDKINNPLEESDVFQKVIKKLPVIYRDVITLKYVHEFSNEEIALFLNINEATVRKRMERAKNKIQELIEKENLNVI